MARSFENTADQPKRKRVPIGFFGSLIFHLSLILMLVMGIRVVTTLADTSLYGFSVSEATVKATAKALSREAKSMVPAGADPRMYWATLVDEELKIEDVDSARGWLLMGPDMLDDEMVAKFDTALAGYENVDRSLRDEKIEAVALGLLPPEVKARWDEVTGPSAIALRTVRDAGTGAVTGKADNMAGLAGAVAADFFVLGDIRDLTIQGSNWVQGKPVDEFILALSGVGLGLTAVTVASAGGTAPEKTGASVLKAAKRADRLTPRFAKHIEMRLFKALPPDRLKVEMTKAFGGLGVLPVPGLKEARVADAFKRATNSAEMTKFADDLTDLRAVSGATSPTAAVRLLSNVETVDDLKKVRLISEAGGPRAVTMAKRLGPLKFLKLAKGVLKSTYKITGSVAGIFASLAGFVFSLVLQLSQMGLRMRAKSSGRGGGKGAPSEPGWHEPAR